MEGKLGVMITDMAKAADTHILSIELNRISCISRPHPVLRNAAPHKTIGREVCVEI
jgi:hypothetical protein